MTFVFGTALCVAICANGEDDEKRADEGTPEVEERVEESEEEDSEPDTEAPTADPEESDPAPETKTEETKEGSLPPPTAPWKRLPVSTKIPVNYDIDLPQDI